MYTEHEHELDFTALYHTGSLSPIHVSVALFSPLIAMCYCAAMHLIKTEKLDRVYRDLTVRTKKKKRFSCFVVIEDE